MAQKLLETCRACHGRGVLNNTKSGEPCACPLCEGSGKTEPLYDRLPYWYILNAAIPAGLGTGIITTPLTIEDRDFEAVWLMATSTAGVFDTEMFDSSARPYQNLPVRNLNQWGSAQQPFPLVAPFILKARSILNFRLTNQVAAANTVQLALSGYDLYLM